MTVGEDRMADAAARPSLVERAAERLRDAAVASTQGPRREQPGSGRLGPRRSVSDDGASALSPVRSRLAKVDPVQLRKAGVCMPENALSRTTEEFRLIKRTVLLNAGRRREEGRGNANLVMVTSSREGEGKTFVSLNLAVSLAAERDLKVLLVEADLSNPSILARMGIFANKGLADYLADESLDLSDVLIRTDIAGLSVLPAGAPHPFDTELLASARMSRLMVELAQRYNDRVVVLDAPPVLANSEPTTLAAFVGQIVFVVQAEKTTKAAIREALALLAVCPSIGFVLNKARFQFGSIRFGSYYKSYRKTYYKRYRRNAQG